jgi:TolB protein
MELKRLVPCGNSLRGFISLLTTLALVPALIASGCGPEHSSSPLVFTGAADDDPAWSPDGSLIAYRHLPESLGNPADPPGLYVVDPLGRGARLVLPGNVREPSWSPDGTQLACIADGGITVLDVMADTTRELGPGSSSSPTWSPDASMLAFDTFDPGLGNTRAVWTVRSDGTGAARVGTSAGGEWCQPAWSPDGGRLLHLRFLTGTSEPELAVMDTAGANLVRLTDNAVADQDAAWSPNGQRIAWTRIQNNVPGVWIMDGDGRNARMLTLGSDPSWSPDGQSIVFCRAASGSLSTLFICIVATGATRTLFQ